VDNLVVETRENLEIVLHLPSSRPLAKAVILDRDGTIIEHIPYLSEPSEVRLLPGVAGGLLRLKEAGMALILHSNQSGVGRGMFDLRAVQACNSRMLELLGMSSFERMCIAPERPDEPAEYRKPSSRLADEICRDLRLRPSALCYVGDRGTDLATAAAAGTAGIGVRTGRGNLDVELEELGLVGRYPIVDDFSQVVDVILRGSEA